MFSFPIRKPSFCTKNATKLYIKSPGFYSNELTIVNRIIDFEGFVFLEAFVVVHFYPSKKIGSQCDVYKRLNDSSSFYFLYTQVQQYNEQQYDNKSF